MAGWKLCLRIIGTRISKYHCTSVVSTRSRRIASVGLITAGVRQDRQNSFLETVSSEWLESWRLGKAGPSHLQSYQFAGNASNVAVVPNGLAPTLFRQKGRFGPLSMSNQKKPLWIDSKSVKLSDKLQSGCGGLQKGPSNVEFPRPVDELQSLCSDGQLDKALEVLSRMDQQGTIPSTRMYGSLLKACTVRKALAQARQVQSHIAKSGLESSQFLGESVVNTLVKCGGLQDALQIFYRLRHRSVFSWTAVISGYTMAGQGQEALRTYYAMRQEGLEANKYTFVSLLKACSSIADLEQGRRLHAEVKDRRFETDLFVGTCLVDMYAKCGSVVDGQNVFDGLLQRDIVSWNAMITGYTQQGQPEKALELYRQMLQEPVAPDDRTFVSALQACGILAERGDHDVGGRPTSAKYLDLGRTIHADAVKRGYGTDLFIGNTLVSMYGKCGSIVDAQNVFDCMSKRNVVSWNAMIAALCQQSQPEMALHYYEHMLVEGVSPNSRTFVSALQACGMLAENEKATFLAGEAVKGTSLKKGKSLHVDAWRRGHGSETFMGNTLIGMYGKCGSIVDARIVFDRLPHQNVVSWNAMLGAYVLQGKASETLELYEQMIQDGVSWDDRTFVSVIQVCGMLAEKEVDDAADGTLQKGMKYVQMGKALHADAWRKGVHSEDFVGNGLLSMYGKCGCIEDAQHVFDDSSRRDVVSWNAMFVAYAQQGNAVKALQLYEKMLEEGVSPNDRTFVSTLQACGLCAEADSGDRQTTTAKLLQKGKAIHADAWGKSCLSDVFIRNTLVSMYAKCQSITDAQNVFDELSERSMVAWSVLLAAYAEQGQPQKALQLYEQMLEECASPDGSILVSVFQACGMLAEEEEDLVVDGQLTKVTSLAMGKAMHAAAWRKGFGSDVVGNTLISMYGKCGSITDAQHVFDRLSRRDVVSWTALLSAYVQQGQGKKVLELYTEMQASNVSPNDITLVCILQACSNAGRLDVCSQIRQTCMSTGLGLSPLLGNTLIHAYSRCSSMVDAHDVFRALPQPDVVSWNALMAGYARQGDYVASLQCYEEMQAAGVTPDQVTFLSILSACSHAGLVDKGVEYFQSMSTMYGVTPDIDHYVTVVDLLGRAGYLTAVEHLLSTMPVQPNLCLWICLLGACRKHSKVLLGKQAFECAVQLQPRHPVPYILMSSIYAHAGLWESAMQVNELRQKAGAWKKPGQSWIGIGNGHEVHAFLVGDCEIQKQEQLSKMLVIVSLQLAVEGHVPDMRWTTPTTTTTTVAE